ncbi:hypothetical protein [Glutamicibacter sp. X7]
MMTEPYSPVSVEQRILEISNRIAKSARVCNERYVSFLDADRAYDRAYAVAFLKHEGPQTEKRYAAEEATTEEREARDVADAAYRYADRLSKALQAELMAMQSVNKSVIAQYGAAGVGER